MQADDVEREQNRQAAKEAADAEQLRRIAEVGDDEAEREKNRQWAKEAADAEQQRRIAEHEAMDHERKLERENTLKMVTSLVEEERSRRVSEAAEAPAEATGAATVCSKCGGSGKRGLFGHRGAGIVGRDCRHCALQRAGTKQLADTADTASSQQLDFPRMG